MANTNLFLLAAPRSGSTQLAAWLSTHSDVGCTFVKEPNYFSSHEFSDDYVRKSHLNDIDPKKISNVERHIGKSYQFAIFRKPEQYKVLTDALTTKYRMDASTTYLHCPEAISKILDYNPTAKFVILLRDPLARLISHYRLAIRTGRENRTLAECLKAESNGTERLEAKFLIRQSLYYDAISRVVSTVSADRFKIVLFEEMVLNPKEVLASIGQFLQIAPSGFELSVQEKNEGVAPRFPMVNRFIAVTGIKTYLRSILPKKYKEKLKSLYFSDKKIQVDVESLNHYRDRFKTDFDQLSELIPEIKKYWQVEG